MAKALAVKSVFVTELIMEQPAKVRTLAICINQSLTDNMEWLLSDTPCEQITQGKSIRITNHVRRLFPKAPALSIMDAKSYVGIPMKNSEDQVIGHMSILHDQPISHHQPFENTLKIFADRASVELERIQAERQLIETKEQCRRIINNLQDAYYQTDNHGYIRHVSTSITDIIGYSPKEITHTKASNYYVEKDGRLHFLKALETSEQGKVFGYETTLLHKKGQQISVSINAQFLYNEQQDIIGVEGTIRNISQQKKTDEHLRKLFRAIEQVGESIIITDRQGIIEYVNPAFSSMTGYSAKESIGKTPSILNSGKHDSTLYRNIWRTICSGRTWHGKVIDKRKDGSLFPASLTISPVHAENQPSHYTHFIGIQSDLSRLEDMEQKFYQAQKMEAIGTLVGGIAHDFNNMLAGITGNLYLIKSRAESSKELTDRVIAIEQLCFRAADMIQQLLTFSRRNKISMQPLELSTFLEESMKFLRPSIPENIILQQHLCNPPFTILGDKTQLHQILMNLINNARDALEKQQNPHIDIRLTMFHTNDAFLRQHIYFKEGTYARLSIEDNGHGIKSESLKHLFEPFFTTKQIGKGSGLGLAMVYGAVKIHQGYIEVDSTPGKGTAFHIYFPLLTEQPSTALQQHHTLRQGNGETILIVDDEQHVHQTTAEVLKNMGYQVLQAGTGEQALQLFHSHGKDISLAIVDIVMPHINGVQLARKMRHSQPKLPIIFVTGYDRVKGAGYIDQPFEHCKILSKPMPFNQLGHTVHKMLHHHDETTDESPSKKR